MSSFLKQQKKIQRPLKIVGLSTPSFDTGAYYYPFPFIYDKQTSELDIDPDVYDFTGIMIDTTNENPLNTDYNVEIMGGTHLVESLGSTFEDYIRAWFDGSIDAGSDIDLYRRPIITKIKVLDDSFRQNNSVQITTEPPSINGHTHPNAGVTYVFKTPMIVRISVGGNDRFITFYSTFDKA